MKIEHLCYLSNNMLLLCNSCCTRDVLNKFLATISTCAGMLRTNVLYRLGPRRNCISVLREMCHVKL